MLFLISTIILVAFMLFTTRTASPFVAAGTGHGNSDRLQEGQEASSASDPDADNDTPNNHQASAASGTSGSDGATVTGSARLQEGQERSSTNYANTNMGAVDNDQTPAASPSAFVASGNDGDNGALSTTNSRLQQGQRASSTRNTDATTRPALTRQVPTTVLRSAAAAASSGAGVADDMGIEGFVSLIRNTSLRGIPPPRIESPDGFDVKSAGGRSQFSSSPPPDFLFDQTLAQTPHKPCPWNAQDTIYGNAEDTIYGGGSGDDDDQQQEDKPAGYRSKSGHYASAAAASAPPMSRQTREGAKKGDDGSEKDGDKEDDGDKQEDDSKEDDEKNEQDDE